MIELGENHIVSARLSSQSSIRYCKCQERHKDKPKRSNLFLDVIIICELFKMSRDCEGNIIFSGTEKRRSAIFFTPAGRTDTTSLQRLNGAMDRPQEQKAEGAEGAANVG